MKKAGEENYSQLGLVKKIGLILEKEIGPYFHASSQGSGKTIFLKLVATHGNQKKIELARKFLKEVGMVAKKNNGHGIGGSEYTLIYELFDLSSETQEKIKVLVKELTGFSLKHKVEDANANEIDEVPEVPVIPETSSPLKKRVRRSEVAKCKGELSNFLNAGLYAKGIKPNSYPFVDSDQEIVINCQNEKVAKEVEILLSSVSVREGSSVMVDCENFWRNFQNATLSAPDSFSKEVFLLKILKINKSFVVDFTAEGINLKLRRKDSFENALEIFKANGWKFSSEDDCSILLDYYPQVKEDNSSKVNDDDQIEVIGKLKRLLSLTLSPEVKREVETAINDQEARQLLKRLKELYS